MKLNGFGEGVLQKDDDIAAYFADQFGTDSELFVTTDTIDDDPNFGWCCIIVDDDLNEVQAHDFDSEAQLRAWLTDQGVEIR